MEGVEGEAKVDESLSDNIFLRKNTVHARICPPACRVVVEKVISRSLLLSIATTYMTLVMNVDRE